MFRKGFHLSFVLVMMISVLSAHTQPLKKEKVPAPLEPWVGWVLAGHEGEMCPNLLGSDNNPCAWPAFLALALDEKGGIFTQDWRLYAETWIRLPGDVRHWPQDVKVDNAPGAVVLRDLGPGLKLAVGAHTVAGTFQWDSLPELLQIPPETGLLSLMVKGQRVEFPNRDEEGRLWLQRTQKVQEGESRLDVIVHRRIVDDIPLQIITRVELKVSGKNREVLLGRALPAGFVPMSLTGPLPARIEKDGRLRVQVRPGSWEVELTARHEGPVAALTLPRPEGPWDADEAWVFDARNDLRIVSVEGAPGIDPQQTQLPEDWRQLPAYLMRPGDTMKLIERRRGDSDPAPDRLILNRTFWLDFNGGGFTVKDTIAGTLSRSWRLEMAPETKLGRVAVGGKDQFITALAKGGANGFEIRQGQVDLEADSRIAGRIWVVPAVSWNHNFEEASGLLHLPPGWRLIHAIGVDRATPTWVDAWTLLDLFLVLIIAFSVWKLWGAGWGVFAFVTATLSWQEDFALQWIWLVVPAGEALVRVLPEGGFLKWMKVYRFGARIALALLMIPFLALQARQALYPQLVSPTAGALSEPAQETKNVMSLGYAKPPSSPMPEKEATKQEVVRRDADEKFGRVESQSNLGGLGFISTANNLYAPDPTALVSTGPGLPDWTWSTVSLTWRGPVEANQRLRFFFISPRLNFLLSWLRIVLTVVLVLCLLGFPVLTWFKKFRAVIGTPKSASAILVILMVMGLSPRFASADFPSNELLQELQTRLLKKPDCAPNCAESPRLKIDVSASMLTARLEVNVEADTAVPLPGGAQQWVPQSVVLDGSPARGLLRTTNGILWIPLSAGMHQIILQGALPDRETVQIPLPLKPHRVEAVVNGWILDGLHEDGLAEDNLQLTRKRVANADAAESLQQETLPPFVAVERSLMLGLTWQVETRVVRLSPPGAAVVVEIPLLDGESVTTADVRVEKGKAQVSMSPQTTEVEWTSVLPVSSAILFKAPDAVPWVEVWMLNASPIWHAEPQGIPTIHAPTGSEMRVREWRPWPGESVTIKISRPEGVPGQTLTIDKSTLTMNPGLRSTDITLALNLRSSRGNQHVITLPDSAELQSVSVDNIALPVRQEGRTVTLTVTPGGHNAQVIWRQANGISLLFRTPDVNVGIDSVNAGIDMRMPADRWMLVVGGPRLGPAVLFWSLLVVLALLSIGLGRYRITPLRAHHWFLLSLGLTQTPLVIAAIIAVWFLVLGARKKRPAASVTVFQIVQFLLVVLTMIALGSLLYSITQGLLGRPEMQISGNGSSAQLLRWYQDRSGEMLPHAWVISVPLMVYRLAMLAWALWLAASFIGWIKWGWTCFTTGGMWKTHEKQSRLTLSSPPKPPSDAAQ